MRFEKKLMIIASCLLSAGVKAQSNDSVQVKLSETVVLGSRFPINKSNQTRSITKLDVQKMSLDNPQTTADLLGTSGQVFIQKSQLGGGSPMFRGFATHRLLYAVDGVRMNTAIFRAGNLQQVISLDPFSMEGVELLFGSGSVGYGSDAIGGVMGFTTKQAKLSDATQLLITGSSAARYASANNEKTFHFDASIGGKKWALLTSFSSFNFGDLLQGSNGPTDYLKPFEVQRINQKDEVVATANPLLQSPTGYNQFNWMQKMRFKPNEDWDLNYAFHFSTTSPYPRYDRLTRVKKGTPVFAVWQYGPQRWLMNQFTAQHLKANAVYDQAVLRMAVQRFEESRVDRKFNKTEEKSGKEKVDAYSVNLDLTKNITPKFNVYYGAEYVMDVVRSYAHKENIETKERKEDIPRYPFAHWQSLGIYAQGIYEVLPTLLVEAGARYNYTHTKATFKSEALKLDFEPTQNLKQSSVSGSVGLKFQPKADSYVALNLTRGFRAPNLDDIGKLTESVDGAVVVPNPSLKPEYANGVELSFHKHVGSLFSFDLAGYYTYLEQALARRPFLWNNQPTIVLDKQYDVLAIQNLASAYVYGVQFGMQVHLPFGLNLNTNLNYQAGKEKTEEVESAVRHAPPFFGKVALNYAPSKRLNLELSTIFQAERSANNMPEEERGKVEMYALNHLGEVYSPAWYTLNFKAQYYINKNLNFTLGVENITDQRYRPYSSGISGPGRNCIAALYYNF